VKCTNCGDPVDPRRVELGYDYCLKEECQQRRMKRVLLASVAVNKAADFYARAEELLPPRGPSPGRSSTTPEDPPTPPISRPKAPAPVRAKSTMVRLREKESALDAALEASYERFCRGEITAKEMDRERNDLVSAFNEIVKRENIRYRGMMRKTKRMAR